MALLCTWAFGLQNQLERWAETRTMTIPVVSSGTHSANTWALHYMCVSLSKCLSPLGHLCCPLGTAWLTEILTDLTKIVAKDITRSRPPEKENRSPRLSERRSAMSLLVVVFTKNKPWWFRHLWYLLLTHTLFYVSLKLRWEEILLSWNISHLDRGTDSRMLQRQQS